MRPSACRAAHTPNASQAQFAYHQRPAACTRYAVGTAESGLSILISSVAGLKSTAVGAFYLEFPLAATLRTSMVPRLTSFRSGE